MNRRLFFKKLTGVIIAASAPTIFLPKLIKPVWKVPYEHPSVTLVKNSINNPEAFAAYIYPVLKNALSQYQTLDLIYDDYETENCPSIPMDLYYGPMPRKNREECIIL
jgi:hypothetical protein